MVSFDEIGNYIEFSLALLYVVFCIYIFYKNKKINMSFLYLFLSIISALIIIFIFICDTIEPEFIHSDKYITFVKYGKKISELLLCSAFGYFIGISNC